jgi:15-cis-phytoene synthase
MLGVMQDAFAHCAELVRTADRDRYLAALFAPAEDRDALYALYAFNVEVARVREAAHEPLPGEVRLQWWSEVVNGERGEEARANPVASALLAVIERHNLAANVLDALIDAHRFDLYDEPMARLADLEAYARKTSSAVMALAAQILTGAGEEEIANLAGIAFAIVGLLREFPIHAARGQLYVPIEIIERHDVQPPDIFAGRSSAGLNEALAELRNLAHRALATAHERLMALPGAAVPAFLPVALVRPSLVRLEHSDPFLPAEISPWRRQWLIWRAARNPARIAG